MSEQQARRIIQGRPGVWDGTQLRCDRDARQAWLRERVALGRGHWRTRFRMVHRVHPITTRDHSSGEV